MKHIEEIEGSEVQVDFKKITRFELINSSGRVYTKWDTNIELQVQDDGRTLKVFIYD